MTCENPSLVRKQPAPARTNSWAPPSSSCSSLDIIRRDHPGKCAERRVCRTEVRSCGKPWTADSFLETKACQKQKHFTESLSTGFLKIHNWRLFAKRFTKKIGLLLCVRNPVTCTRERLGCANIGRC